MSRSPRPIRISIAMWPSARARCAFTYRVCEIVSVAAFVRDIPASPSPPTPTRNAQGPRTRSRAVHRCRDSSRLAPAGRCCPAPWGCCGHRAERAAPADPAKPRIAAGWVVRSAARMGDQGPWVPSRRAARAHWPNAVPAARGRDEPRRPLSAQLGDVPREDLVQLGEVVPARECLAHVAQRGRDRDQEAGVALHRSM